MRAVDLFAGWGGFTCGAEAAGVEVVWAGNHWPLAVQVHSDNHPKATHVCQDLRQADWSSLPNYQLLLASPSCQGFSPGSQPGRRPYHDAMRATAWSVVDCAEVTRPRAFIVENVPEFLSWALYPDWSSALRRLGYHLVELVLVATAFGVPQLRKRLFIVGTRRPARLSLQGQVAHPPAFGPCVDWSASGWRPVAEASSGAQARFAKARARLGPTFLSQHVTDHPGVALSEPIRTITTKDQWGLVHGDQYRPLTPRELARGMGFPESYRWPDGLSRADVIRGLGNAVCPPVAEALIREVLDLPHHGARHAA